MLNSEKDEESSYKYGKIRPYHLLLFASLVVFSIICNTSRFDPEQVNEKVQWSFLEDRLHILSQEQISTVHQMPFYKNLKIVYNDALIYDNKETEFITNFGILPIVRQLENGEVEALLGIKENKGYKILRLLLEEKKILSQSKLPLFSGGHQDIDKDRIPEFMGYLENYPDYCTQCDSVYYNPLLIYEMRPNGFALDTTATQTWIQEHYNDFYGFQPDSTIIVKRVE